jgi:hypothetical protein
MTEHNEIPAHQDVDFTGAEVSDEDIKSFIEGGPAPSFHPVLQVWQRVLEPAAGEAKTEKVTPQYATRILQSYPGLTYADMVDVRDLYYGKILELSAILDAEIGTLEQPFEYFDKPEVDAEENATHYKALLTDWQKQFLTWELAWDCTSPTAAAEVAAISEVHKMFFGPTGIVAYLDNIKLEFTEDDQAALAAELEELKAGSRE